MNKSQGLSLFFGGLLPIVAFTIIDEQYGPVWGTIAGMVFGIGEIIFEKVRHNKVATITWVGNGMILTLGGISIISQDGIWFKLQPALFEGFFAAFLWGSLILKKPFLAMMAEKQGTQINPVVKPLMNGMTFRLGLFFAAHAAVATWAALEWSTAQWALLKGVYLFASFFVYLLFELLWIRHSVRKQILAQQSSTQSPKN